MLARPLVHGQAESPVTGARSAVAQGWEPLRKSDHGHGSQHASFVGQAYGPAAQQARSAWRRGGGAMTIPCDYYEVLGVPRDADTTTIKDAFRKLARRYHPDISTEPDAEQRFREIAEAYGVLSDPAKRASYDVQGSAGLAGATAEDLW